MSEKSADIIEEFDHCKVAMAEEIEDLRAKNEDLLERHKIAVDNWSLEAQNVKELGDATERLGAAIKALRAAIKALPVEEWVEQDKNGDAVLIGYVMQASGEWDRVLTILEEINNE